MSIILIGDISTTHIRYSLFHITEIEDSLIKSENYPSDDFNLDILLTIQVFLQDQPRPIIAVFSICGIIINNKILANDRYGTGFDPDVAAEVLGISKIYLLNDFQNIGYAVTKLSSNEFFVMNRGCQNPTGIILCVSIGTGIGQCFLLHNGKDYNVLPSEGGHQDYSPKTAVDKKFYDFVCRNYTKLSLTYSSLINEQNANMFYHFLREEYTDKVNSNFDEIFMRDQSNQTKIMIEAGFNKKDVLAAQGVKMWLNHVGYYLANLFMNFLPSGGFYLLGETISKNYERIIKHSGIREGFYCGRANILHKTMKEVPIYIVKSENLGTRGAMVYTKHILFNS
ncbi:hypothetical protein SteCoe_4233 [Stentor coeruleus]|uniref:Glucokinase n=1 Tax=Stentor coeruleus TaxID=5963 RepID=A0A1R2CV59_9CILI|nr:hypothetical protein SteCoe_4233 [Stentor coeruleus]